MNYLTTEDGKPIKSTNPLSVKDEGLDTSVQSVEAELAALNALIGEVQAAPTANTLLARVKALETELATIKSTAGIKKIVDPVGLDPANNYVQLVGSFSCLSTEPKPAGQQNDTLLEYNATTKESKVYKYISGDWREL